MATFLFDEIIFGPVRSRRLGVSLGINLLPTNSKVCNFDCIYCECGWTKSAGSKSLPSQKEIRKNLEHKLLSMKANNEMLDVITYAGNGEPTLHPHFAQIVNDTIELRNRFFPKARIAVLSNSTMLHSNDVFEALLKVDQNILKLDSAIDSTLQMLNQPHGAITVNQVTENLKRFKGDFILQTMFVRGEFKGKRVDNTTEAEVSSWLDVVKSLNPKEVMVYTIARSTPIETLERVPLQELESIATKVRELGIHVQVSA